MRRVEKYIDKNTYIKLETYLGQKLNKKYKSQSGTYADILTIPWFSAELPINNDIKVFVNLTYVISCFGKLETVHNGRDYKELKMKIELRFVFPKKPSFEKFDYIGANYILDWSESEKEYSLSIKTFEDCTVEFYREADRTLGLVFDNDCCNDIIDDVYARITGFTGYLLFDNTSPDAEIKESDYEELDNLREKNEEIYNDEITESVKENENIVVANSADGKKQEVSELEQMLNDKVVSE